MKSTFFGLQRYDKSMEIQAQVYQLVKTSGFPAILGFEYYPVITVGKRAHLEEELGGPLGQFESQGFDLVETDRGGQATLHSPGQLVIYPLVPIRKLGISVKDYVGLLESATIHWLSKWKIEAAKGEDAGVFSKAGKIAFIGIRVEDGITRHGISINISNDLALFGRIRSCGVQGRKVDSLLENNVVLSLKEAFESWVLYFTHELLVYLPAPETKN